MVVRLGFGPDVAPPFYGRAEAVGLNAIYPRIQRHYGPFRPNPH